MSSDLKRLAKKVAPDKGYEKLLLQMLSNLNPLDLLAITGILYTSVKISLRDNSLPFDKFVAGVIGYQLAKSPAGTPPVSQIAGVTVLAGLGLLGLPDWTNLLLPAVFGEHGEAMIALRNDQLTKLAKNVEEESKPDPDYELLLPQIFQGKPVCPTGYVFDWGLGMCKHL